MYYGHDFRHPNFISIPESQYSHIFAKKNAQETEKLDKAKKTLFLKKNISWS